MAALLITAVAGTGASTGHLSERDGGKPELGAVNVPGSPRYTVERRAALGSRSLDVSRSEKCHARKGLRFYVRRHNEWRSKMGVAPGGGREGRLVDSVPWRCPLYLAKVWRKRAWIARQTYEVWVTVRTLRDFAFSPGNHAWHKAVREVQRVFPGTESWLLSCSAAEGGHGRWVGYSGVAYSTWLRDSDTVGGPLQFRFSTFTGMYRRAVEYAVYKGFRVPRYNPTTAWRSALGQALAGGWARYTGNDNSHWSASWGRGC